MVMLDAVTHERLVVRETEFGPSILLHDYEDLDFLEDTFVEQHDIETSRRELPVESRQRRFELFVHSEQSLPEIQRLLDAMSYAPQKPL
jgi:hypothetical protein